MELSTPLLIAVMGPTASGKTDLAEQLAEDLDAQLLNGDAFQIYRGMDIGTAKPTAREKYELLDLRNPDEGFGVGEFVRLANEILEKAFTKGRSVVVVGGTGLYIRALLEEYQDLGEAPSPNLRAELNQLSIEEKISELRRIAPDALLRIDIQNPARVQRALERARYPSPSMQWQLPPFRKIKLALVPDSSASEGRITRRVEVMVQNGWKEEVVRLRELGYRRDDPGLRAIGYRTLWRHIDGELNLHDAMMEIMVETRSYAKRQRTWLRAEPNVIALNTMDPLSDARRHLNLLFL